MVYAKNALIPIPDKPAKGILLYSANNNVMIMALTAVAVNTAPTSIPAAPKIAGLTANT